MLPDKIRIGFRIGLDFIPCHIIRMSLHQRLAVVIRRHIFPGLRLAGSRPPPFGKCAAAGVHHAAHYRAKAHVEHGVGKCVIGLDFLLAKVNHRLDHGRAKSAGRRAKPGPNCGPLANSRSSGHKRHNPRFTGNRHESTGDINRIHEAGRKARAKAGNCAAKALVLADKAGRVLKPLAVHDNIKRFLPIALDRLYLSFQPGILYLPRLLLKRQGIE